MKKILGNFDTFYAECEFKFIEVRLSKPLPGNFTLLWRRGQNKTESDHFNLDSSHNIIFNLSYKISTYFFCFQRFQTQNSAKNHES